MISKIIWSMCLFGAINTFNADEIDDFIEDPNVEFYDLPLETQENIRTAYTDELYDNEQILYNKLCKAAIIMYIKDRKAPHLCYIYCAEVIIHNEEMYDFIKTLDYLDDNFIKRVDAALTLYRRYHNYDRFGNVHRNLGRYFPDL